MQKQRPSEKEAKSGRCVYCGKPRATVVYPTLRQVFFIHKACEAHEREKKVVKLDRPLRTVHTATAADADGWTPLHLLTPYEEPKP